MRYDIERFTVLDMFNDAYTKKIKNQALELELGDGINI